MQQINQNKRNSFVILKQSGTTIQKQRRKKITQKIKIKNETEQKHKLEIIIYKIDD